MKYNFFKLGFALGREGKCMKAKEETKKIHKTHKRKMLKNVIIFLAFIISVFCMVILYDRHFGKNKVYASETLSHIEKIEISEAKEIEIEDIITENIKEGQKEEYTVQEITLEYITKYRSNTSLPKGTIQVIQQGREGKQEVTTKKVFQNGELIAEEQVASKITKASVNKIVEIGAANYSSDYKVKVGDLLYVTSDRLSVMVQPNEQAQKIATLAKGNELKLLEIQNEWYKISGCGTIGYVKAESTTYIDNTPKPQTANKTAKSKADLMATLSFDMALNKPSGLTLEQFRKVLSDTKDSNKIFQNNAEYFYYIEQQYNINGVFVAAVGIHESAWGTSQIAKNKKNLFGYGAYDSNPYQDAYHFSGYSESIDLLARVFVKYYINPKGTSIYGGEKAVGTYYNGSTLTGINTRYATDKNWANGVYNHMKYLYNKL